jgi:hypothetical protein
MGPAVRSRAKFYVSCFEPRASDPKVGTTFAIDPMPIVRVGASSGAEPKVGTVR